jgi:hypothetical protein
MEEQTGATVKPRASASPGAIVVLVGAVVAIVGVFLPWVKAAVSGTLAQSGLDVSQSASGLKTNDGKLVLACAIILIIVGVVGLVTGTKRWMGVVAIILGLIAGGSAVINIFTLKTQFIDEAMKLAPAGTSQEVLDRARVVIQQFIDQGAISIKAGVGLFLSAAGGVAVLLGGIMLLGERSDSAPAAEVEAGGGIAVGPTMGGFQDAPPVSPPPSEPVPPAPLADAPVPSPQPQSDPLPSTPSPAPSPADAPEGDAPAP